MCDSDPGLDLPAAAAYCSVHRKGESMQSRKTPRSQRVDQPKRLTDVLQRKTAAAQQMRASMPAPAKRLPGHGHRVHGR
jgi:hypothetical protein